MMRNLEQARMTWMTWKKFEGVQMQQEVEAGEEEEEEVKKW